MHAYGDNLCEFIRFFQQFKMRVQSHSHPSRFSCTCTSSTAGVLVTPSTSLTLKEFARVQRSRKEDIYYIWKKTVTRPASKKGGKKSLSCTFYFSRIKILISRNDDDSSFVMWALQRVKNANTLNFKVVVLVAKLNRRSRPTDDDGGSEEDKKRINELLWKMKRVKVSRSMRNVCSIHLNMFLASEDVENDCTLHLLLVCRVQFVIALLLRSSEWIKNEKGQECWSIVIIITQKERGATQQKKKKRALRICRRLFLSEPEWCINYADLQHCMMPQYPFSVSFTFCRHNVYFRFLWEMMSEAKTTTAQQTRSAREFWILLRFSDSWWDIEVVRSSVFTQRGQWTVAHTK